jgi:serine protease Do
VVVLAIARKPDLESWAEEHGELFDNNPELREQLEEQLRRFNENRRNRPPIFNSQGSGIILREDGYILTNSHVVDGAEKIRVRLKDGTEFEDVEIKGVDRQSDVAVLKVKATGLAAARLGDSARAKVGEFAIAIGAPFELDYSFTIGHVSGKGRRIFSDQVMMDQDFLQTDASINPGNSGGPLVNIDGEVIGINTLIRGLNTGIGFAVPINLAREIADQLIRTGRFNRSWLGVGIENLRDSRELREQMRPLTDGVVVRSIRPDGPSADSELKPADVITAVDGEPTPTVQSLKSQIRTKPAGKPVSLTVHRGERKLSIEVKPGELPEEPPALARRTPADDTPTAEGVGLKVQTLTRDLAKRKGIEFVEGVLVTEVETGGLAEAKGIRVGEVITEVNRRKVSSARAFQNQLKSADPEKGVLLHVQGEGGRRWEVLKERSE